LPPAWLKSKPGTVPDQGNQKVHVSPGDITMTSVGLCPSAALYFFWRTFELREGAVVHWEGEFRMDQVGR